MPGFTTNQWAILLLVLILGWLLGLLSRSGGARWRRAYETERAENVRLRQADATRARAAEARVAELEAQIPCGVGAGVGAAAAGHLDDLALIRGIGRSGEIRLNDVGVHRYHDLTSLRPADEAELEARLGAEPGIIARDRWREQAELLAAGRIDEHRRLFD